MGAAPPATCAKSIQVYVSRLRKQLGDQRLATQAPGYVLQVEPSELDLARFEQLADEARRGDPRTAARKLRDALALWRGSPLADLAYEPFAQPEIARLEELRMAVLEQRIDADLAVGRHAELVGELEALIVRNPLRERLRFQLMLALYRSARQAEALNAYRAARSELSEELGLEPSEELKRLEQAILRHDPGLDLAAGASREGPLPPERPVAERALLIVPRALYGLDPLLRLAEPLAASESPHELIVAGVVPAAELAAATLALAERRDQLLAAGLAARTAAFSSPRRGEDIVRLAGQENVDLLLMDAGSSPLDGDARVVLEQAPCDVALLAEAGGSLGEGPVVVPFGARSHDWAALRLGAWVARATDAPLRLIGSAADGGEEARDASRLLADASLIVQRTAGIVAEPLLARPGRQGIAALAEGSGPARGRPVGALARGGTRPCAGRARTGSAGADGVRPAREATGRPRAGRDPHAFQLVADRARALAARRLPASTRDHPGLQPAGPKLVRESGRIGRPALKEATCFDVATSSPPRPSWLSAPRRRPPPRTRTCSQMAPPAATLLRPRPRSRPRPPTSTRTCARPTPWTRPSTAAYTRPTRAVCPEPGLRLARRGRRGPGPAVRASRHACEARPLHGLGAQAGRVARGAGDGAPRRPRDTRDTHGRRGPSSPPGASTGATRASARPECSRCSASPPDRR